MSKQIFVNLPDSAHHLQRGRENLSCDSRNFADLDGHVWGMFWMNSEAMQGCTENAEAAQSNQ